tara:strand:+ start:15620 stop:15796 length:177 start_codon:yes stop_codon:yes gene_type:complete
MKMTEIALTRDEINQRKINLENFFSHLVEDKQAKILKNNLIEYLDHIDAQINESKESQ